MTYKVDSAAVVQNYAPFTDADAADNHTIEVKTTLDQHLSFVSYDNF